METQGWLASTDANPTVKIRLHCGTARHRSMEGGQEDEPYRIGKLDSEGLGSGSTQGTHSSLTEGMASQAGSHKG